jgi:hypothetical protein
MKRRSPATYTAIAMLGAVRYTAERPEKYKPLSNPLCVAVLLLSIAISADKTSSVSPQ